MTVAAVTPEQIYLGNGTAAPLAVPFRFLAPDDLVVTRIAPGDIRTVLVRGVDYSVAGEGGLAGTVTPLAPIPVGTSWSIRRLTPRSQSADYVTGDSFSAETHELALDRLAMVNQEQDVELAEIDDRLDEHDQVIEDGGASADAAEASAIVAQHYAELTAALALLQGVYNTIPAGLAATANGAIFGVPTAPIGTSSTILIYRNDAGVATPVGSFSGANLDPFVIVATGQSNMVGSGPGGTMFPTNAAVQVFNLTTHNFQPIDYVPFNNPIGGFSVPLSGGDNNLAFAFAHQAFRKTGRVTYLIIVPSAGTAIDSWVGAGSPMYAGVKATVEEALAEIGAGTIDVLLWHQGETDSGLNPTVEGYAEDIRTVIEQFRAEAWFPDDTPFIAGETTNDQEINQYNEAIRGLTTDGDAFTFAVSANGLAAIDPVGSAAERYHFSGPSLYELGLRYWDAYQGNAAALAFPLESDVFSRGARDYRHIQTTPLGQAIIIDPIGDAKVSFKGPSTIIPVIGGWYAGQRAVMPGASVGVVSAVVNPDGTHTVVPSKYLAATIPGDNWMYQYWNDENEGGGVTRLITVTGLVDNSVQEMFTLDAANEIAANVTLTFFDPAVEYTVDWGVGAPSTQASGVAAAKVYGAAYTGPVVISYPRMATVTNIASTAGNWSNRLSDFAMFDELLAIAFSGSNRLHGNFADLPQSLTFIEIGGSNYVYGDLADAPPAAYHIILSGNNSVNALSIGWDGPAQMEIVALDGADRTAAQVDAIIMALAYAPAWSAGGGVALNYPGNAARTAASDAARATIIARGGVVNTNP